MLPLAFPAYVLAYAYTDLLSHPGPVQTRAARGHRLGAARLLVPQHPLAARRGADVRLRALSLRLPARRARPSPSRSATAYLAARSLGQGPRAAFLRVSLPMARPAIAAGVLLAIMETIADYGTVAHFAVRTFSTGIYQAWFAMQDRAAAAQLALCLLAFALFDRGARAHRARPGRAYAHARRGAPGGDGARRRWPAGAAGPRRRSALLPGARRLRAAGGHPRPDGAAAPGRTRSTRATSASSRIR